MCSCMKRSVAVVCGGDSSESEVSLRSAKGIFSFLDKTKYEPVIVTIHGAVWMAVLDDENAVLVDKNDFSYVCADGVRHHFDFAYITIHGTPGENGRLQGYFDMLNIPYSCCGVLAAALTFNKYACNHYLQDFGVNISPSILLRRNDVLNDAVVVNKIGLPCFIKSNVGGSSFGCTKVKKEEDIKSAVHRAFEEGDEVIVEAFMKGVEITCGVYKTHDKAVAFPITEVVSKNEFFDYNAKYNGEVSEITPARIPDDVRDAVQRLTLHIYDILGCKGIIRVDYILTEGWKINLLEINTTPGMTATSFIPQQVRAAGLNISDVLTDIIEDHF